MLGGVGEKETKAAGRGGLVDSHSASGLHSKLLTESQAQQLQVRQKLLLTEMATDCKEAIDVHRADRVQITC